MVGDLEKSSFSNIEQQSLEFVKYTLDPWGIRWEQSIQRSLLSQDEKAAYFVKFNLEGLLRGDYQSRMNGYAIGRQNGWMSAIHIGAGHRAILILQLAVGLWIMSMDTGDTSTFVLAIAMTDAAEAAMPSIFTVTLPL